MKRTLLVAIASCASMLGCENDVFMPIDPTVARATSFDTGPMRVTLVAADPLRSSFDFIRRDFGGIIQSGAVKNGGSHIVFHTYVADSLTVGVQGGETGRIVDLGSDDDVAGRIGVTQTAGRGQGFAGLALADGAMNDPEAARIFESNNDDSYESAKAALGHVYALRVIGTDQGDIVVKLLVVEHQSETNVTFQWIRLR